MGKKSNLTTQNQQIIKAHGRGKTKFIVRHGVLNWGISTGLIFLFIQGLIRHGFSLSQISEDIFSIGGVITLVIFAILGAVWGSIMWKWVAKEVEKDQYNQGKKTRK